MHYSAAITLVCLKISGSAQLKHLTRPLVTTLQGHQAPHIPHGWRFIYFRSYCRVTFLMCACLSSPRRNTEHSHQNGPGGLDSSTVLSQTEPLPSTCLILSLGASIFQNFVGNLCNCHLRLWCNLLHLFPLGFAPSDLIYSTSVTWNGFLTGIFVRIHRENEFLKWNHTLWHTYFAKRSDSAPGTVSPATAFYWIVKLDSDRFIWDISAVISDILDIYWNIPDTSGSTLLKAINT